MKNNIVRLLAVSRPISWINTAYPFAAGYLILGGGISPLFIIGTLFFLIPYNILMYGINDVFDYESDIKNPRKGGMEGAREPKEFHRFILWAGAVTSAPFILALLFLGTLLASLILLFVLFMVVAYSVKGLRFKERPILDSITSSIHFVGPPVYALSLFGLPSSAWPFVTAFFLWGMASHAFGAVQDVIPDREGKLASIATVFGARATVRLSILMYLLSSIILSTTGTVGIIVAITELIYVANCLPYITISDADSAKANEGWRRFIWLNIFSGAVVTIAILQVYLF